jgi:cytochrome c oxidase assembly factor CtaG
VPEAVEGHWRSAYGGLAVLLLAVVSPIDYWADDYFFVHMVEHIVIMFFAPILIVAGAPWLPLVHAFPVTVRRQVGRSVLLGSWAMPLRTLGRFVTNGVYLPSCCSTSS